jgi:hypothetical protein
MSRNASVKQQQPSLILPRPLACRVIPPRTLARDPVALETAMHSLVLDDRHPVALEMAGGTALGRQLIIRATTSQSLEYVKAQIHARYPQARCVPLPPEDDPFRLEAGETVTVTELAPGAPSYLPLQSWDEKTLEREGMDPLLGVLAALEHLPQGIRAIAQLTLVPAPPSWSQANLRKAVEHPLEPERARQQINIATARLGGGGPSAASIIGLALVIGGFFLYRRYQQSIPAWVTNALLDLLHGQVPQLAGLQFALFWGGLAGVFCAAVGLFILVDQIRRKLKTTRLYDMRLVSQKTTQMAYRTRLRLYAIGPAQAPVPTRTWRTVTFAWAGWHLETLTHNWNEAALLVKQQWNSLRWYREEAQRRRYVIAGLIAAYRQFHLASGAFFIPKRLSSKKARLLLAPCKSEREARHLGWSHDVRRSSHFIGVSTLPSLWHVPPANALTEIAFLEHRRSRSLPMSPLLAQVCAPYRPIGYNEHADYRVPFAWLPDFSRQHSLIAGKSGEGKSTFMEHVAKKKMEEGDGLILLDPHGDLAEKVLRYVPPSRIDDVVFIDLSDRDFAVGLNPLDVGLGRGRDKAISDLIKTLSHIWASSWGPRMEIACEMALKTLMASNQYIVAHDPQGGPAKQHTLLNVLPLLTNESFCHSVLQQVNDPYLHRWWSSYYEPMSLYMQRDRIDPVLTKMAKFESAIARRILGQSSSTLNFSQLIADEKIIILKLAKGTVGEDVARILGATFLGLAQISLEEQGSMSEEDRKRLLIMIDEFQVFSGVDYAALAELRKYGATFFLATQSPEYLVKLDSMLLPTVLANVRQVVAFHMSAKDAYTLHRELGVEEEDILTLDQHMCYIKLTYAGIRQPTFSLKLTLPRAGDEALAREVRRWSRLRYARPADEVEVSLLGSVVGAYANGAAGVPPNTPIAAHSFPGAMTQEAVMIVSQTNTSTPLPPEADEVESDEEAEREEQGVVEGSLVQPASQMPFGGDLRARTEATPMKRAPEATGELPSTLIEAGILDPTNPDPAVLQKVFSPPSKPRYRGRKAEKERLEAAQNGTYAAGQPGSNQKGERRWQGYVSTEQISESDLAARGVIMTTPPGGDEDAGSTL